VSAARHNAGAEAPPQLAFLPAGEVLMVQPSGDGLLCSRIPGDNTIYLSGHFAVALDSLLHSHAEQHHITILEQISRQHPWLKGLAQASGRPVRNSALLCGQALGLLFIEMTARCNERCRHCYAESGPERTEMLPFRVIRDVLGQARQWGNPTIQFTGGDPLVHPDIVAAVRLARELEFADIEIYTNGLLLGSRMLGQLAGFSPRFAFSLYAHEAATHDHITRVPGSFARTVAAVRRTREAGLDVRIGVTLMPENIDLEAEIRRFVEDEIGLPSSRIHVARMKSVGRGSALSPSMPEGAGHHGRTGIQRRAAFRANAMQQRQGKLCIAADGSVYPCVFARETRFGNVHESDLSAIMQRLDERMLPDPSATRWQRCRQSLSCRDCQIISYALGTEVAHGAA